VSATAIAEPLRRWSVGFEGDRAGFSARFEALAQPMEFGPTPPVAQAAV